MQLEVAPPLSRERKARRYGVRTAAGLGSTGAKLREEARKIAAASLGGPAYDWQAAAPPKLLPLSEEQRRRLPRPPIKALIFRPGGCVEAVAWKARSNAPRRAATSSRSRQGRRARRVVASRDGPSSEPPDEPPPDLEHLRPLTAVGRAYLRAEVDRRRREVVAAHPEISPEVFHLFDEDRKP
jgi:hypothetical protein